MGRRLTSTLATGNLINQQKHDICKHAGDNPSKPQRELCVWAQKTFNLAKAPRQATISNALKKRKQLLGMKATKLTCKRSRVLRFPELDRALANWILLSMQTDLWVAGGLIKLKAARFASLLNLESSCDLVFSNGWLVAFKECHGFKGRQCFGESGSVCCADIEESLPRPVETTSRFQSKNIYNFDETGLFYELAPDRTVSARAVKGTKKCKARITIAFAVNADGSDKCEPLFIGTALRPRCLKKVRLRAWLRRWVKLFNRQTTDDNRRVLALLDNASSHTVVGLELINVEVAFLPPNTTSELQTLDTGTISSFKRRYRQLHLENALYREEQGEKKLYAVGQLQAMRWAKQCWAEIAPDVIRNCWRNARILGEDALSEKQKTKQDQDLEDRIAQCMARLRICDPMTMHEVLNPAGENDVHIGVQDEDFAAVAIEDDLEQEEPDDDAGLDIQDEENSSISRKQCEYCNGPSWPLHGGRCV